MPGSSSIEWTQATWNPVTGCTKVSPGCAHCYAETFAERWRGIPGHAYEQGFDLRLWPDRLEVPLRWRKPRMVFVNSMSDLFHEDIPQEYIARVFGVMAAATQHTFQVLTKRPERMVELLNHPEFENVMRRASGELGHELPLPNVWLGVTIENRRFVQRADLLRQAPAAVRFISAEPLLGPLIHDGLEPGAMVVRGGPLNAPEHERKVIGHFGYTGWADGFAGPELNLDEIDWVICGGESGARCRSFDLDWARALRDRCEEYGTAFFLKQLGGHPNKRGGDQALLDGRRHVAMPEPRAVAA